VQLTLHALKRHGSRIASTLCEMESRRSSSCSARARTPNARERIVRSR
jgi:hypothetical protein